MTIPNLDCKGLLHIVKLPSVPGLSCFAPIGTTVSSTPCFCKISDFEHPYLSGRTKKWLANSIGTFLASRSYDIRIWVMLALSLRPKNKDESDNLDDILDDIGEEIAKALAEYYGGSESSRLYYDFMDKIDNETIQLYGFFITTGHFSGKTN